MEDAGASSAKPLSGTHTCSVPTSPSAGAGLHKPEAAVPQRRVGKTLTTVPEQERPINYRLEVALVGTGARLFAQTAANSERAAIYKPKRPPVDDPSSQGSLPPGCLSALNVEQFILFCPIGGQAEKELARIRFWSIELFSQSLPMSKDPASTNLVVAFLFWRVPPDGSDDAFSDFTLRMAEIKHIPRQKRPYTAVLAFQPSEEQKIRLEKFTEQWKTTVVIDLHISEECDEDEIMESVQDVCDGFVNRHRNNIFSKSASIRSTGSVEVVRSSCCAIS